MLGGFAGWFYICDGGACDLMFFFSSLKKEKHEGAKPSQALEALFVADIG